ncbi:hypothetical protein EN823_15605, partial [bacterium M00.F.Ca.ET.180.01.1.1]
KIGKSAARIGIEPAFLQSDDYALIPKTLRDAKLIDATGMLESMRAIKTAELAARHEGVEISRERIQLQPRDETGEVVGMRADVAQCAARACLLGVRAP